MGPFSNSQDDVTNAKDLTAIFANSDSVLTSSELSSKLGWYEPWLERQWAQAPRSLRTSVQHFTPSFLKVAELLRDGQSIQECARSLLQTGHLATSDEDKGLRQAVEFAFAAAGWQTMLYRPAIGTVPPQQLAIADVLDGYTGQAYMVQRQDAARARSPLMEFLLGFGLMLPKENTCISDDEEDCLAFEKTAIVRPKELNASFLQTIGKLKFRWVDEIAPHLELDKETNTVFLFMYPSFCIANLPEGQEEGVTPIYRYDERVCCVDWRMLTAPSCASPSEGSGQWASKPEVAQFLREVLLSYRLLFAQESQSRRAFSRLNAFKGCPEAIVDPLLGDLCGNRVKPSTCSVNERDYYRLKRDFPILRSRIAILQQHMVRCRPRGWRELWKDKRDSAQWLTFWAVITLGLAGVLLAAIQVALQAAQLARS